MRRSKTVNGVTTRHIWDNGNIVGESDESGEITAKYSIRGKAPSFNVFSGRLYSH